jgi:hypothetical protein
VTSPAGIEAQHWSVPAAQADVLESLADAIDLTVAGTRYWVISGAGWRAARMRWAGGPVSSNSQWRSGYAYGERRGWSKNGCDIG